MGERDIASAFDVLIERSVPTETERQAAARHRQSVESALEGLGVFGLWESGSFHHGTGVRGHCDVDVIVSLKGDRPSDPDTALVRVRSALEARFPYTTIRVSRPAVVVDFAGGAERWEVIPGYYQRTTGDWSVYSIPAPGGTWMDTAPSAHLDYVNRQNAYPAGGAKRLARLMKAYKYANSRGFRVSSFYLEMRAARYMADESSFLAWVDFLRLGDALVASGLASMQDPTGVTGLIRATSTEASRHDALTRLEADLARTRDALALEKAGRRTEAFAKMEYVFIGGTFPARFY